MDSVLVQTYQNWECLVVDDGSTDGTKQIINNYQALDDRLVSLERSCEYLPGGNGARNMGLKQAKGDWVMFLDSDDLLLKTTLEERVNHVNRDKDANMYIFHTGLFYEAVGDCDRIWNVLNKGGTSNLNLILRFIDQDLPWHTTGVLWKKEYINKIGKWNEELLAWQDWEIHLRALLFNPRLAFSKNPPDNFYRQDVENSIASKKNTYKYFQWVASAVKVLEPLLLLPQNPVIIERYRYLIIRFFIIRPQQLKDKKLLWKICLSDFNFKTISGFKLKAFSFLEILSASHKLKKILRKIGFKNYYRQVKPHNTHLAAKFAVDYDLLKK